MINRESALAAAYFEKGKLPGLPVLDFHAHVGPFNGGYLPAASAQAMVNAMDGAGVALLVTASHMSLSTPVLGEQVNIESARAHPGRIYAYHSVLSRTEHPDALISRMEAHRDVYVGVKFHGDGHNVALCDARNAPALEYANARGLLALCHTWQGSRYDDIDQLERASARYPRIAFICGHSFHANWRAGIALAASRDNVYLELTAVENDRGVLELMCESRGERVLFGVDQPWFSYHYGIGTVLAAEISEEDRRNILFRNGRALLMREGLPSFQRAAALHVSV